MELQINQFWILKVHSKINSANEYEPDVQHGFKNLKFYKECMYEAIGTFSIIKYKKRLVLFCSFWKNILNITPKVRQVSSLAL